MLKFSFYGETNVGLVRTNNEDTFVAQPLWDDKHLLLVAIDGLGGYEGGEVAAAIARDEIIGQLERHRGMACLDALKHAVTTANNAIVTARAQGKGAPRMGCVLTAAIIDQEKMHLHMVHVGDTRLYCFHQSKLEKLSHDHSLVGYREEIGELTEHEAMNHPQRNIVDRIVGETPHEVNDPRFMDAGIFPMRPNSIYLLCSDGLTDMADSQAITAVLASPRLTLEQKGHSLIEAALRQGGRDNVTVVLAQVTGEEAPVVIDTPRAAANGRKTPKNGRKKARTWHWLLALACAIAAGAATWWLMPRKPAAPAAPAPVPAVVADSLAPDSLTPREPDNFTDEPEQPAERQIATIDSTLASLHRQMAQLDSTVKALEAQKAALQRHRAGTDTTHNTTTRP